ncbi:hypothetical protein HKX48_001415, partial [Thoreauomyces humboldtii]
MDFTRRPSTDLDDDLFGPGDLCGIRPQDASGGRSTTTAATTMSHPPVAANRRRQHRSSASSSTSSTTSSAAEPWAASDEDTECQTPTSFLFSPPKHMIGVAEWPSTPAPLSPLAQLTQLNRTLTQSVLRVDRLTTQYLTLRTQLTSALDDIDAQDRAYESCVAEIGMLKFEKRFLSEVVGLAGRTATVSPSSDRRSSDVPIGSEESEEAAVGHERYRQIMVTATGNKRWTAPTFRSSSPDLEFQNRAVPSSNRRWTVTGPARIDRLRTSSHDVNEARRSMTLLPHPSTASSADMEQSARITLDDLTARKMQRAAFTSMTHDLRIAVQDSCPASASAFVDGKDLSYGDDRTTTLNTNQVPSRILHMRHLADSLAATVAAVRDAARDLAEGPAPAYAAWIREAEREREGLARECGRLRDARRAFSTVLVVGDDERSGGDGDVPGGLFLDGDGDDGDEEDGDEDEDEEFFS